MKSELEGVWSIDARFGLGAQSDEILVFKPDGTGWLEEWNFYLCSVDFFEWTPTSPGWVALSGVKRMVLDVKTNRLVDSGDVLEVTHLPYQINEELTPSRLRMKVLHMQFPGSEEESFGFVNKDIKSRAMQIEDFV